MDLGNVMAAAILAAISGFAATAQTAAIPDCPAPTGVVKVALPADVPPALRKAMGDIALPGEPFDTTDVYVKGHKRSRYIFVWNVGKRWIVAAEQGGIALRDIIYTYELGKDGKTAVLIKQSTTFAESVCSDATRLATR